MRPTANHRRRGFTLIEIIAATAIMAMLTTSGFVLVRTANTAWLRHRDDVDRRREAIVTLQHIMRRVRQSTRVTAISASSNTAGSLTLLMSGGTAAAWSRNSGTNQVLYGTSSPTNLLANNITELSFVGLKADGSTATTNTELIHAVPGTDKYTVRRPSGS